VAAGEYISNINLLVNKNVISYMKVTTSKNQTISKGPVPKSGETKLTFNATNQPVGFYGNATATTINSIGVLTTDSTCNYSQWLVDLPLRLAEA